MSRPEPSDLPIREVLDDLRVALRERCCAVLIAPPGTGKTTGVPPALLDEPWTATEDPGSTPGDPTGRAAAPRRSRAGRILVVEPRRVAARGAARRMAAMLGEEPGATVGWSVRGERRVSSDTRIEALTPGMLLRRLQADPSLDGVAAVLLDEFHERSIDDDLLLAFLLDVRSSLRPDLRLLVMSATLDAEPVASLLGANLGGGSTDAPPAPVITASAVAHPVETFHRPATTREPLEDRVAAVVLEALAEADGDVLVFLPGRAEIRQAARALAVSLGAGSTVVIEELHGGLTAPQQDRVLAATVGGVRRVVLATSIAETSVTVPGVRVVVDAGRRRTVRVHPGTGLPGLVTEAVSMSGADQRRGRAGRSGPGRCYRLWSPAEERHRRAVDRPEVLDGDLAQMLLQVAAWGSTVDELELPDPPSPAHRALAEELLVELRAMDPGGRLTGRGRRLAELGFHPRLGAVVLAALSGPAEGGSTDAGAGERVDLAADLAAILDTDLPGEVDLVERVRSMRRGDAPREVMEARREWRRRLSDTRADPRATVAQDRRFASTEPDSTEPDRTALDGTALDRAVAAAIVAGFRDRLARRRTSTRSDGPGRERTVVQLLRGGEVTLDTGRGGDPFESARWVAVPSLDRSGGGQRRHVGSASQATALGRAHLAVAVPDDVALAALGDMVGTRHDVRWDPSRREPVATVATVVGSITLEARPWRHPSAELLSSALLDGVDAQGPAGVFDRWPEAEELIRRLRLAGLGSSTAAHPSEPDETGRPERGSPATILDRLIDRCAAAGRTRRSELEHTDVAGWISDSLAWAERRRLGEAAPTHLELGGARRLRIHYTADGPVLSTRLQDLLGVDVHPHVADGRVAVLVELLSPAGRPLQRTSDLPAFWRGSYSAVRAEMRGRYPKHDWPERPWE